MEVCRPHPRNYNEHSEAQVSNLRVSLRRFGQVRSVVVQEVEGGYVLVAGHGVWEAARREGVEVLRADVLPASWPEVRVLAYLAADNELARQGSPDEAQLAALVAEVKREADGELARLAAGAEERLRALEAAVRKAQGGEDPGPQVDRAAELQEKWQVERGQVWEVPSKTVAGRCHRVMCGDSTDGGDVGRLMDRRKAILLLADPPYNVGVGYGPDVSDNKPEEEYEHFSRLWFGLWCSVSKRQLVTPGCVNLARWIRYFEPYHVAPWTKTNGLTNGRVSKFWCWEPVCFFGEPDEWSWEAILFFGEGWKRKRANDVFDYPIGAQQDTANHPCPKPLAMWRDLINSYTSPRELVADGFVGSGMTIKAAEQVGRIGYGMEIEPKFVAVTLERLVGMGLEPRITTDGEIHDKRDGDGVGSDK